MNRYFIFPIILSVVFETVLALKCYSSNFEIKAKKIKQIYHELKECSEYVNKIRSQQGKPEGQIVETVEMSCFTTIITTDQSEHIIKGCLPKNYCDKMKKPFQNLSKRESSVQCTECFEDECNLSNSGVIRRPVDLGVFLFVLSVLYCKYLFI